MQTLYISIDELSGIYEGSGSVPLSTLLQLTNDNQQDSLNTELLNNLIEIKSAEIDGYLIGRYQLPLKNSYPILKEICAALVVIALRQRRKVGLLTEAETAEYDRIIAKLKAIQKGEFILNEPSGSSSENVSSKIYYTKKTDIFGSSNLDLFTQV